MELYNALIDEYRRIESVGMWSEAEKAAARSVLRGVAAQAGCYSQFMTLAMDPPSNVVRLSNKNRQVATGGQL